MWQRMITFFFPPECVGCEREDFFLCPDCVKALMQRSKAEAQHDAELTQVWSLFEYQEEGVQQLIKHMKFRFAEEVLSDLLPAIEAGLKQISFPKGAMFCPIPLHRLRKNYRGFNQSDRIIEALQRTVPFPTKQLLRKKKHTKPQSSLGRAERLENLKDAFVITGAGREENKQSPIILVDDVTTTMSTLRECAKILKQAGYTKVYGLVLARQR